MYHIFGLPLWLSGKESACNVGNLGDAGLTPGSGRSPGGGHSNPLQYSCLENPMDRAAWRATVHGVARGQPRLQRLSTQARTAAYLAIHLPVGIQVASACYKWCCNEHWSACIFSKLLFLFLSDLYPGVELLGHMVVLF